MVRSFTRSEWFSRYAFTTYRSSAWQRLLVRKCELFRRRSTCSRTAVSSTAEAAGKFVSTVWSLVVKAPDVPNSITRLKYSTPFPNVRNTIDNWFVASRLAMFYTSLLPFRRRRRRRNGTIVHLAPHDPVHPVPPRRSGSGSRLLRPCRGSAC